MGPVLCGLKKIKLYAQLRPPRTSHPAPLFTPAPVIRPPPRPPQLMAQNKEAIDENIALKMKLKHADEKIVGWAGLRGDFIVLRPTHDTCHVSGHDAT